MDGAISLGHQVLRFARGRRRRNGERPLRTAICNGARYTAFVDPAGGSGQELDDHRQSRTREKQRHKTIAMLDLRARVEAALSVPTPSSRKPATFCMTIVSRTSPATIGAASSSASASEKAAFATTRPIASSRPLQGIVALAQFRPRRIARAQAPRRSAVRALKERVAGRTRQHRSSAGRGLPRRRGNAVAGALVNASSLARKKVVITEAMITAAKKQGPYRGLGAYKKRATPCFF